MRGRPTIYNNGSFFFAAPFGVSTWIKTMRDNKTELTFSIICLFKATAIRWKVETSSP